MESPCLPTLMLASSGSSTKTRGAGVDLTFDGELEPTSLRNPRDSGGTNQTRHSYRNRHYCNCS